MAWIDILSFRCDTVVKHCFRCLAALSIEQRVLVFGLEFTTTDQSYSKKILEIRFVMLVCFASVKIAVAVRAQTTAALTGGN